MALESIALIPSGVKATKVYSQLPVNGNGDFTFDRGTSADQTRVNKNGLIEDVAVDVPRLDYLDGGCPSLLLEPSSENLIEYSEDFTSGTGYWSIFRGTTTANSILSPDGSLNATKYEEDSATGQHFLRRSINITSGNDYTASCFFKAAEFSSVRLRSDNQLEWAVDTTFDLSNGTFVISSGDADMIDYGNGWYRCVVSGQALLTASTGLEIETSNGVGTLGSGIYLWGAMWEQQSYATSYIPTSGSTETRAAETASKTGLSSYINSTEGVLYAELEFFNDNSFISISDGSTSNQILIGVPSTLSVIRAVGQSGGSIEYVRTSDINAFKYNKIAFSYKNNEFKFFINGTKINEQLSGNVPLNMTNLQLAQGNNANVFYGKVKALKVYKEALSDLELATLTGFTSFAEMRDYLGYASE